MNGILYDRVMETLALPESVDKKSGIKLLVEKMRHKFPLINEVIEGRTTFAAAVEPLDGRLKDVQKRKAAVERLKGIICYRYFGAHYGQDLSKPNMVTLRNSAAYGVCLIAFLVFCVWATHTYTVLLLGLLPVGYVIWLWQGYYAFYHEVREQAVFLDKTLRNIYPLSS